MLPHRQGPEQPCGRNSVRFRATESEPPSHRGGRFDRAAVNRWLGGLASPPSLAQSPDAHRTSSRPRLSGYDNRSHLRRSARTGRVSSNHADGRLGECGASPTRAPASASTVQQCNAHSLGHARDATFSSCTALTAWRGPCAPGAASGGEHALCSAAIPGPTLPTALCDIEPPGE
jgi:hypothetical protein